MFSLCVSRAYVLGGVEDFEGLLEVADRFGSAVDLEQHAGEVEVELAGEGVVDSEDAQAVVEAFLVEEDGFLELFDLEVVEAAQRRLREEAAEVGVQRVVLAEVVLDEADGLLVGAVDSGVVHELDVGFEHDAHELDRPA